jgi:riboflavin kinase/FMN adenylyltransferase
VDAAGTTPWLEVHFFDPPGDLYGQYIEVQFGEFLRPERRFGSIEELKAQIARDVELAKG